MSRFINLPTVFDDFIAPRKALFDAVGGGLSGGRNPLGESISINTSGGPQVICQYIECNAFEPEQHEYLNMLAARLNDGDRFINVSIRTDFMGPFPSQVPIAGGIPHSDGSTFSDGAGYSQATVFGTFEDAAALNAGQIVINVFGAARKLRWSDWFSVYNAVKGWRVHRTWEHSEPVDVTRAIDGVNHNGKQYTVAISPPLREATSAGQRIEFARPRCVMKFPDGFTLPYEPEDTYVWRPTVKFVEAW